MHRTDADNDGLGMLVRQVGKRFSFSFLVRARFAQGNEKRSLTSVSLQSVTLQSEAAYPWP